MILGINKMVPTVYLLAVVTASVVLGDVCQDTAPGACAKLAHNKPDLCSDVYIAQSTCPKYCGLCPPTSLGNVCQDTAPDVCALLAHSKPDLCSDEYIAYTTCQKYCGLCPLNCYTCDTPTLDPANCTTISNCSVGEICSSRELKSTVDGRHEYTYGCISKQVCDGIGLNIAFGKREVSSRSLSISCCDSDMCNHPVALACEPDLIFMVDDGGNVSKSEFHMAMDFVSKVLKSAEISDSATKVSVFTYEMGIHTVYNWSKPQELDRILQSVNSTTQTKQKVHIAYSEYALYKLRTQFLVHNAADRADHPDVIVLVTNGDITSPYGSSFFSRLFHNSEQADALRHDGVRIVLVKVGHSHTVQVENHVDAVVTSGAYNTLNSQLSDVIAAVCK